MAPRTFGPEECSACHGAKNWHGLKHPTLRETGIMETVESTSQITVKKEQGKMKSHTGIYDQYIQYV